MPSELGHRDQVMEGTSQRLHCEDQVTQEYIMAPMFLGPCHQDYIVLGSAMENLTAVENLS